MATNINETEAVSAETPERPKMEPKQQEAGAQPEARGSDDDDKKGKEADKKGKEGDKKGKEGKDVCDLESNTEGDYNACQVFQDQEDKTYGDIFHQCTARLKDKSRCPKALSNLILRLYQGVYFRVCEDHADPKTEFVPFLLQLGFPNKQIFLCNRPVKGDYRITQDCTIQIWSEPVDCIGTEGWVDGNQTRLDYPLQRLAQCKTDKGITSKSRTTGYILTSESAEISAALTQGMAKSAIFRDLGTQVLARLHQSLFSLFGTSEALLVLKGSSSLRALIRQFLYSSSLTVAGEMESLVEQSLRPADFDSTIVISPYPQALTESERSEDPVSLYTKRRETMMQLVNHGLWSESQRYVLMPDVLAKHINEWKFEATDGGLAKMKEWITKSMASEKERQRDRPEEKPSPEWDITSFPVVSMNLAREREKEGQQSRVEDSERLEWMQRTMAIVDSLSETIKGAVDIVPTLDVVFHPRRPLHAHQQNADRYKFQMRIPFAGRLQALSTSEVAVRGNPFFIKQLMNVLLSYAKYTPAGRPFPVKLAFGGRFETFEIDLAKSPRQEVDLGDFVLVLTEPLPSLNYAVPSPWEQKNSAMQPVIFIEPILPQSMMYITTNDLLWFKEKGEARFSLSRLMFPFKLSRKADGDTKPSWTKAECVDISAAHYEDPMREENWKHFGPRHRQEWVINSKVTLHDQTESNLVMTNLRGLLADIQLSLKESSAQKSKKREDRRRLLLLLFCIVTIVPPSILHDLHTSTPVAPVAPASSPTTPPAKPPAAATAGEKKEGPKESKPKPTEAGKAGPTKDSKDSKGTTGTPEQKGKGGSPADSQDSDFGSICKQVGIQFPSADELSGRVAQYLQDHWHIHPEMAPMIFTRLRELGLPTLSLFHLLLSFPGSEKFYVPLAYYPRIETWINQSIQAWTVLTQQTQAQQVAAQVMSDPEERNQAMYLQEETSVHNQIHHLLRFLRTFKDLYLDITHQSEFPREAAALIALYESL